MFADENRLSPIDDLDIRSVFSIDDVMSAGRFRNCVPFNVAVKMDDTHDASLEITARLL